MKVVGIGSPDQLNKADKVIAKTGEFSLDTLQKLQTV
jgi:hypothetical protein